MTATTETLEQTTEPGRPSPWLRFGAAFLLGSAVALLLAASLFYLYDQAYRGRVLPGVHLGGLDLSGLTETQARAEIESAYASLSDGRIVLRGIEDRQVITFAEIERRPDVDALLGSALAIGREGSPFDRALTDARTALRGVELEPTATFDAEELAARVTAVADGLRIEPENSSVVRDENGAFAVVPGHVGREADPAPLILTLTGALAQMDAPSQISVDLGVKVSDADVTAMEAYDAKLAADRMAAQILLVVGDEKLPIETQQLAEWITFHETEAGGYEAQIDLTPLTGVLEALAKEIDRDPVNARFVTDDGEITEITASKDGYRLEVAPTVGQIRGLLAARASGAETVELVPALTVTPPALTTAQAEAVAPQMVKVSEWTTYFPIGEKNGFGANIWIPALEIDGYVVGPHETFDFWDAIGPVTRERGYRDGGAIINGRTEPQGALAGGICSCSTTLFNAALRGGFEMGARRNHYYYIDRYPLGLDATVFISASGSVQTMSWTNDTDYPVLIRGYRI
jgi:vancomycin resistance protein YoaR